MKFISALIIAFIFVQLAGAQPNSDCNKSYFGYRSDGVLFSLSQLDEEITLRPDIRSEASHSYPFQYKTVLFGDKEGPVGLRPVFSFGPASNDRIFTRTGDRVFIDVSRYPNGKLELLTIDLKDGDSKTLNPLGEFRLLTSRITTIIAPNRIGDSWIFNLRHGFHLPPNQQDALSVLIDIGEGSVAHRVVEQPFTTRGFIDLKDDLDIELQLVSHDLHFPYVYLTGSEFAKTWPASEITGVFQIKENQSWAEGAIAVELTYQLDAPKVNGGRPYKLTQYIYSGEPGLRYQRVEGPQYYSFQYDGANKEFIWHEKIIDADAGTTTIESPDVSLAKVLNDYKSQGWRFFSVLDRDAKQRSYIIRRSAHPRHEIWQLKLDALGERVEETLLCVS